MYWLNIIVYCLTHPNDLPMSKCRIRSFANHWQSERNIPSLKLYFIKTMTKIMNADIKYWFEDFGTHQCFQYWIELNPKNLENAKYIYIAENGSLKEILDMFIFIVILLLRSFRPPNSLFFFTYIISYLITVSCFMTFFLYNDWN